MSDTMEATLTQKELDRARKLLNWLENGWIKATSRLDSIHLADWLSSEDQTVIALGLALYDRLSAADPKGIDKTPEGIEELGRLKAEIVAASLPIAEPEPTERDKQIAEVATILKTLAGGERKLILSLLSPEGAARLNFYSHTVETLHESALGRLLKELRGLLNEEGRQRNSRDRLNAEIDSMISQGTEHGYKEWWERKLSAAFFWRLSSRRNLELKLVEELHATMAALEPELTQSISRAIEKREADKLQRQAARAARPAGTPPPSEPTWQVKQAGLRTGKANPQGLPGVVLRRGVTVAGAGKGTKEKSRKQGK